MLWVSEHLKSKLQTSWVFLILPSQSILAGYLPPERDCQSIQVFYIWKAIQKLQHEDNDDCDKESS
ncbi:hypothetical protein HMPREF9374_2745 [Desmospora sp. 8437]|nr:hypothetical protein HMPREF9374_2745 [Desmospora sp. 8437]